MLAVGTAQDGSHGVLAIGEAKLGVVVTRRHLDRLHRVRGLLGDRAVDSCRLLCFSGAGFAEDVLDDDVPEGVVLVDLERLYHGA
ncbi:hypothetical protein BH23ACT9_BH23ACT9_39930 [soil metagenome]